MCPFSLLITNDLRRGKSLNVSGEIVGSMSVDSSSTIVVDSAVADSVDEKSLVVDDGDISSIAGVDCESTNVDSKSTNFESYARSFCLIEKCKKSKKIETKFYARENNLAYIEFIFAFAAWLIVKCRKN